MKLTTVVQKGFTLIELMIVVAIISVLAAVAIPQYQNYTAKAKGANAMTAASSLQTAIAVCAQENGGLSGCDLGAPGMPSTFTATKEVASASVKDGVIELKFAASGIQADINDKKITFTPKIGDTGMTWKVTTDILPTASAPAKAVYDLITKNNIVTNTGT